MIDYLPKPRTTSKALMKAWEKINERRQPPRVNLPALSRRDAPFMSTWKADPGHVFISSDFTSLEPSITASFGEDPNYRYATFEGIGKEPYVNHEGILMIDDIYLMTASVFPGIGPKVRAYFSDPINQANWLKDPEIGKKALAKERKVSKPACLGFSYGMGPKKFKASAYDAGMDISASDCKAMYNGYWEIFAGIRGLVKALEQTMDNQKSIVNPFGYRLTTEPHKAFNAVIQSSASGVMDVHCLKFFQRLSDMCITWKFVALVHDEIIFQVPEDRIEEAKLIQDQCVVELNQDLGWPIPMRLGWAIAKTFAEIK